MQGNMTRDVFEELAQSLTSSFKAVLERVSALGNP